MKYSSILACVLGLALLASPPAEAVTIDLVQTAGTCVPPAPCVTGNFFTLDIVVSLAASDTLTWLSHSIEWDVTGNSLTLIDESLFTGATVNGVLVAPLTTTGLPFVNEDPPSGPSTAGGWHATGFDEFIGAPFSGPGSFKIGHLHFVVNSATTAVEVVFLPGDEVLNGSGEDITASVATGSFQIEVLPEPAVILLVGLGVVFAKRRRSP